jgi:uncharacterized protein YdeI (YjbR/CyaY-like superfamily)
MAGAVQFFPSRQELRFWFEYHHAAAPELWVGFYKAHTGRKGVSYLEAVEEALCFGWIDTTVRRIDADRYANRFTPRRPGSRWSRENRERFRALSRLGQVTEAGRVAFKRTASSARAYSYESRPRSLAPELLQRLRSNPAAWRYFSSRPPGYRRLAAFWVMSAKRAETQERRLSVLIDASIRGRRPRAFEVGTPPHGPKKTGRTRSPDGRPR